MNPAEQTLRSYVKRIDNPKLRSACWIPLDSGEFLTWPAAISHHHNYAGGLLTHTAEVMEYAFQSRSCLPILCDFDTLAAACLFHDYAKIREYEIATYTDALPERVLVKEDDGNITHVWQGSDYLKKIGHVSGSTMDFYHIALVNNVEQPVIDAVSHCILSHHGRREWGSPVEPQTVEAMILHHADMLSAKLGATRKRP